MNSPAPIALAVGEKLSMDSRVRQKELGQFLTPEPIADLMASFFGARWRNVSLIDAGAGGGALSRALVARLCAARKRPETINVIAYELDPSVIPQLQQTHDLCASKCAEAGITFGARILNEDFIAAAVSMVRDGLFDCPTSPFNAAIVNPPYRKISSDSDTRRLLRSAGIETSNLYSGFLALLARLLARNGEMVAITPRSFCNGMYFKPFRELLFKEMSLRRIHVFESRSAVFSADNVLQENIIIHAVKTTEKPETVIISSSSGEKDAPISERQCNYDEIISPRDPEQFVHLVMNESQKGARLRMDQLRTSLIGLGIEVSTGRVVDFRARDLLVENPTKDTYPLIYPCHFNGGYIHWPKIPGRKPNAIRRAAIDRDLLVPAGVYVLVKRFSAKEEKRRVMACVYDSSRIEAEWVGFENHLNYIHCRGNGMPIHFAKGLTAFLNSTTVDTYFRQFNGHTQVNATDLRNMKYPTYKQLESLGRKIGPEFPEQTALDIMVEKELS